MIKPKAMSHLTVFGPKSYMKQVIDTLYELNAIHIEDHTKKSEEDVFDIGEPLEANEKYADLLVKVRSLISNINIQKREVEPSKTSLDIMEKKIQKLNEEISEILREKEYFSKINRLYEKKSIEKSLNSLKITTEQNIDYSSFLYYIGYIDRDYENLKLEIEKSTKQYILYSVNVENLNLMALFIDKKKKEIAEKLLDKYNFSPIDNPVLKQHYNDLKAHAGPKFVKLDNEADIIQRKLLKIENELNELKMQHSSFFLESEKRLKMETDKAEAPLRFATTKNTFLIKGWVPTENSRKLEETLNKITNKKVMIKLEKAKRSENAPVAFNHPKIVEPFEAFMDLYTLPTYKEIDPTFFMFLTFPIFFGFMLGDVGYGLVCLLLFLFLRNKMPGAKNILNAFIIASISSIIFGMVFGEYFGFEEVSPAIGNALGIHAERIVLHGETEVIYPLPHLFSRSHGINDLLSIAVLFGIVHILIGLVIGFINIYRTHGLKHAILEKAGWFLVMPIFLWLLVFFLKVITGFVAEMLKLVIPPILPTIIIAIIGIIIIYLGEGIKGVIELPAMISNILSYGRLMAVGLASLSLALVINDLAGKMFASGPVGIFAGILILVLGHTINIALGILSPFLHALRLHYVEFFTKFFQGGGKKFKSFGYSD